MKTINVIIPAKVTIGEPEYFNGHSSRVVATVLTADGATNIRHETLIVLNDEDPTEKFLNLFGATVIAEAAPADEIIADDPAAPIGGASDAPVNDVPDELNGQVLNADAFNEKKSDQ